MDENQMNRKLSIGLLWIVAASLLLPGCVTRRPDVYAVRKSATSKKGMVVSAHPLASEAGLLVLRQGGNAVDASVAVQLALAVVYPRAGNLGGGGFLVYRDPQGEVLSLDYREKAPAAASRDMFLDPEGNVIAGMSRTGIQAAAVPGTVAGLFAMHQRLGRIRDWSVLVEPAIRLAREGFRITRLEAERLNSFRETFLANNTTPLPFVKETPWQPGDRLVQPDLANTLEVIARSGSEGFYRGPVARALLDHMKALGGLITDEDLRTYSATWREPLRIPFREYTLHAMGLPSSGGVLLGQILPMIDGQLDISKGSRDAGNIHLTIEAERRAFADRAAFLGDSDYYPVAVDSLWDPAYLLARMASFDPDRATPSLDIAPGEVQLVREKFETTHLSVTDRFGGAASVTTTLNENYGCKVWVPGAGYFLNDEMDDFSAKPGVPNSFGLIGGEANAIAAGKRPLSSMTPAIIEKDGHVWLVVGTPGGPTIITTVLQVFLNAGPYGLPLREAVAMPRYHHQWLPDEVLCEPSTFSPPVRNRLEQMGYRFREVAYIGLVEAILVSPKGRMTGVADIRGDDHASGW